MSRKTIGYFTVISGVLVISMEIFWFNLIYIYNQLQAELQAKEVGYCWFFTMDGIMNEWPAVIGLALAIGVVCIGLDWIVYYEERKDNTEKNIT